MPMMSMRPAVPLLFVRPSIGPLNVSTAEAGPIELTTSVSTLMMVCGSATRPTIEIIASRAGKIESTA